MTLDPDVAALLDKAMQQRRLSFKQALNDAVRRGLAPPPQAGRGSWTAPSEMGIPTVNIDNALALAAELEDEEIIRKMRVGK